MTETLTRRETYAAAIMIGKKCSEMGTEREVSIIVVPPIDGWVAGRWYSKMGRCASWERRDLRSALVSVFGNEQSWLEIEANG